MSERHPVLQAHWKSFAALVTETQDNLKPSPSDRQVARLAGISAQHYGLIKKGLTGTTKDKVVRIALALKADPGLFCDRAGFKAVEAREPDTELVRFLEHLESQIPECERPRFRRLIKRQAEVIASEFQAA